MVSGTPNGEWSLPTLQSLLFVSFHQEFESVKSVSYQVSWPDLSLSAHLPRSDVIRKALQFPQSMINLKFQGNKNGH
jgi:hypothetical protein